MLGIIIFNICLFVLALICLLLISGVWPPDSPWSPWWTTSKAVARIMFKVAKLKRGQIIYDLGSGTGDALIVAAKEYHAKGVGVEIDPLRYLISKYKARREGVGGEITFINDNFFHVSVSDADVVLLYLVPKALARLSPKLDSELKSGAMIICYRYPMSVGLFKGKLSQRAMDKENKIYVYQINKKS